MSVETDDLLAVLDTSMTTLRVYQRPATGGPAVWTKALSLDNLASSMGQYRKTSRRRRTVPVPPQRTLTASSITNERGRMARRNTSTIIDRAADMFGLVVPRCMSPVSMQGRECTGFCEESPAEEPHVVCSISDDDHYLVGSPTLFECRCPWRHVMIPRWPGKMGMGYR